MLNALMLSDIGHHRELLDPLTCFSESSRICLLKHTAIRLIHKLIDPTLHIDLCTVDAAFGKKPYSHAISSRICDSGKASRLVEVIIAALDIVRVYKAQLLPDFVDVI